MFNKKLIKSGLDEYHDQKRQFIGSSDDILLSPKKILKKYQNEIASGIYSLDTLKEYIFDITEKRLNNESNLILQENKPSKLPFDDDGYGDEADNDQIKLHKEELADQDDKDFLAQYLVAELQKTSQKGNLPKLILRYVQSFPDILSRHISNFDPKLHGFIAKRLVESGRGSLLMSCYNNFTGITLEEEKSLLPKILSTPHLYDGDWNLLKFRSITPDQHLEIAHILIQSRNGSLVASMLHLLTGIPENEHNALALEIIKKSTAFSVSENFDKFKHLSKDVAYALIEGERGGCVAENIHDFVGASQEDALDMALKIIRNRQGCEILRHHWVNFFGNNEKNHEIILNALIENSQIDDAIRYFSCFTGLNQKQALEFVDRCVIAGKGGRVLQDFDETFSMIPAEEHLGIAYNMIKHGQIEEFILNLSNLPGILPEETDELVTAIIENGGLKEIAQNLRQFSDLPKDILSRMMNEGLSEYVAQSMKSFVNLSNEERNVVTLRLILEGATYEVTEHIRDFLPLSKEALFAIASTSFGEIFFVRDELFALINKSDYKEFALHIIRSGNVTSLLPNLRKFYFKNDDLYELALETIKVGGGNSLAVYINDMDSLSNEQYKDLFIKIINKGYGGLLMSTSITPRETLDMEVVNACLAQQLGSELANRMDDFIGIDPKEHYTVALKIIENNGVLALLQSLKNFPGITKKQLYDLANIIIEDTPAILAAHFKAFKQLRPDQQRELFYKILTSSSSAAGEALNHFNEFTGIFPSEHSEIARICLEMGAGLDLAANFGKLSRIPDEDHVHIALRIASEGVMSGLTLSRNLHNFLMLDMRVVDALVSTVGYDASKWIARNFINFSRISPAQHKELLYKLVDHDASEYVMEKFSFYTGVTPEDHKEIALHMINAKGGDVVSANFNKFDGIKTSEHAEIIAALLKSGAVESLPVNYRFFTGIPNSEDNVIAQQIILKNGHQELCSNIQNFKFLDLKTALMLVELGYGSYVCAELSDSFSDVLPSEHKALAIAIIKSKNANGFTDNIQQFIGITPQEHMELARIMIDNGRGDKLLSNINRFTGISTDHYSALFHSLAMTVPVRDIVSKLTHLDDSVAQDLIEKDYTEYLASHLSHFKNLSPATFAKLLEESADTEVFNNILVFSNIHLTQEQIHRVFEKKTISTEVRSWLLRHAKEEGIESEYLSKMDLLLRTFGNALEFGDLAEVSYDVLMKIHNEKVDQYNLQNTGEVGLRELKAKYQDALKIILNDKDIELTDSGTKALMVSILRINTSRFGHGAKLEDLYRRFRAVKNMNKIVPLHEAFKEKIVRIGALSKKTQNNFEHTEAFDSRYKFLISHLHDAAKRAKSLQASPANVWDTIQDEFSNKTKELITNLKARLATIDNPKGQDHTKKRIAMLEALTVNEISNPQEQLQNLYDLKEFKEPLTKILLTVGLYMNPHIIDEVEKITEADTSINTISHVIEIVDHMLGQETLQKLFTNKRAQRAVSDYLDVSALTQELHNMKNTDTIGTKEIKFLPSKGLLFETSGYYSDACWTGMGSIVATPNVSAIAYITSPNKEDETRLAGAGLIIESTSNGEKILIIRGTNPQETIINSLNASDFMEQYIDYVAEIGKNMGVKKIGVVVDSKGAASTNREAIDSHLRSKYLKQARLSLDNSQEVVFNGYNLNNKVFLARDLA